MKKYIYIIAILPLLFSCVLSNDLDYPLVLGNIIEFEVEGQKKVDINSTLRTINVELDEIADIKSLKINKFKVSDGAYVVNPPEENIDLSKPLVIKLKTYQEYEWTITAVQNINRYIVCDNQIGKASFDEKKHMAVVLVTSTQELDDIRFTEMKLEAEGSEILSTKGFEPKGDDVVEVIRDCHFPMVLNCVFERTFKVKNRGELIDWTLKVTKSEVTSQITNVTPWAHHAEVSGFFSGNGTPEIQYKSKDAANWSSIKPEISAGVDISAKIEGLKDGTEYIVRVKEGDEYSPEYYFTTDKAEQLYNMSFDHWYLDGKIWYPYLADSNDSERIWDSANKATANFTGSTTVPEESILAVEGEGKRAAKLESTYAVVKFAAGNIVTGKFVKLQGLGAEIAWGIPFSSKPKALHGYYNYKPAIVDYADDNHKELLGKNDIGQIKIILTDWDAPFHVISSKEQFVDFERDPKIIAIGELLVDEDTNGYKEFTLDLDYRSIRTPKCVVIIGASSRYGDYFTGGVGSLLYLDEFNFIY